MAGLPALGAVESNFGEASATCWKPNNLLKLSRIILAVI